MAQDEGERSDNRGGTLTPYLILAVCLAAVGGMLFGHDTGVISGALLYLKKQFGLDSTMQEVVTSTVLIGAAVGAACAGPAADRWGRRPTVIVFGILFCIGSGATALSWVTPWLIGARFIVGTAVGGASLIAPLYISEMSPKRIRGGLVFLNQAFLTLGILLAYLLDYGFASLSSSWGWRLMFAVGIIPAAVLAIGMWFLPDSPRYLAGHDQTDEAKAVIRRVRNEPEDAAARDVEGLRKAAAEKGSYRDLLKPSLRPALVVGVGLAVFQQVTGINTIIYYAPTFLQKVGTVGKTPLDAILGGAAIALVNFLATLAAIPLVDRVGRRILLMGGMAVMGLSLAAVGVALSIPGVLTAVPWIVVALLMTYVIGFAIGLGPVFWLLISEIYPFAVRGASMSVATVANWVANLVVALTFLTLFDLIGRPGTFWLYAILCVVAIGFVFRFVPETKGRSLEEISRIWSERAGEGGEAEERGPGRGRQPEAGTQPRGTSARAGSRQAGQHHRFR